MTGYRPATALPRAIVERADMRAARRKRLSIIQHAKQQISSAGGVTLAWDQARYILKHIEFASRRSATDEFSDGTDRQAVACCHALSLSWRSDRRVFFSCSGTRISRMRTRLGRPAAAKRSHPARISASKAFRYAAAVELGDSFRSLLSSRTRSATVSLWESLKKILLIAISVPKISLRTTCKSSSPNSPRRWYLSVK